MEHHVSAANLRRFLADWLNHATYGEDRIVVTRHGRIYGALVGFRDLATLRAQEDPYAPNPKYSTAPLPRSVRRAEKRIYRERWYRTLATCLPEERQAAFLASVGIVPAAITPATAPLPLPSSADAPRTDRERPPS